MKRSTIGYTVKFEIHEGGNQAFEEKATEISQVVEETEPKTVMYEWFISEDEGTARLCEWFTDSEGALAHLNGQALTQHLPELLESADMTEIEVYGTPNEKLTQALSDLPVSGPFDPLDGFTR